MEDDSHQPATKGDLAILKGDLAKLEGRFDTKLDTLRTEVMLKMDTLRTEVVLKMDTIKDQIIRAFQMTEENI